MRHASFILPLVLFIPIQIFAQFTEMAPGRQGAMTPMTTVLTGRIVAGRGLPVPDGVLVVLDCGNGIRARSYADLNGSFSLSVKVLETTSSFLGRGQESGAVTDQDWPNCEIYGEQQGYHSDRIRLFGSTSRGMVQVGTLVMHPLQVAQELTISAVSLAAPRKAQVAVEKGREQERKGRWAAAAEYFKKAVMVYPRYALAWLELGRVQMKQNDFQEAEQSLQQAVTHDSEYLPAYAELARIAAAQKQWKQLSDVTSRLIQSAPDSSPEFWFLNSAANYNLGKINEAHTSIERAMRLDLKHQVPQAEYLYGVILAAGGQYKSAADHVSTYLQLQPQARDAASARRLLAEYQKRAEEAVAQR